MSICDVNEDVGLKAVKQLSSELGEGRAIFIKTDVTNPTSFEGNYYKLQLILLLTMQKHLSNFSEWKIFCMMCTIITAW